MDIGNLVNLALRRNDRAKKMMGTLPGNVSGPDQRHVCRHLASV